MPDIRLPLAGYYDPDPSTPDKTYGRRAAVIDGFDFDWAGFRIPRATVDATDIAQWLALDVAAKALADAGYDRESVPRERAGVILGNTLTGEHTRASAMRTRWPFVARALATAATAVELPEARLGPLAQAMEAAYKSAFAPVSEDTLAGGLSNTIAGRICNYFDLHGGGYTVDGACASSLLAVCTAAARLASGELDLALAGGVDVSLDTFELIGFAKTGALTRDEMRVYDRRAGGFIPGEGCAFVVLRRLDDALAAGDAIYATVRGWGVSSDGKGGLTAPARDGQAAALRRAYAKAGYDMRALAFVEGHGTGTRVGDRVELEAIARARAEDGEGPPRALGVTSLKSLIGHTKAAAGVGAFVKAVMAVNRRVVPPTAGCVEPNPVFDEAAQSLYPVLRGEVRPATETLRAGVSAMGFGGINSHVTLESHGPPSPKLAPRVDERTLLAASQDGELLPLAAPSVAALIAALTALADDVEGASVGELCDLAAQLGAAVDLSLPLRAAVVGDTPEPLAARLRELAASLRAAPPAAGQVIVSPQRDAWVAHAPFKARIGFLFPGQGSQQLGMGLSLVARFGWARELAESVDAWVARAGGPAVTGRMLVASERAADGAELERWKAALAQTEVAQPAICLTSVLYARWLAELGVRPEVVGGHSLGELSAFHVAGAFAASALFELAAVRGQAMGAPPERAGTMSSLSCSKEQVEALLAEAPGEVVLANLNGPAQMIVSGEVEAVAALERRAIARGIAARRLPVSNAFHSRLVEPAAARVAAVTRLPDCVPATTAARIVSAVTGAEVAAGTSLRDYFAAQVLARVDFQALVERLRGACDLLIEVGPGRVLSGLVGEIVGEGGPLCLPVAGRAESERDRLVAVAAAFCHGAPVRFAALAEGRLVRPFVPASRRRFIDNPCERPLVVPEPLRVAPTAGDEALASALGLPPAQLAAYLRRRGRFLSALIRADLADAPVEAAPPAAPVAAPAAAPPAPPEVVATSLDLLVDMAVAQTGFPRGHVTPEARLLDDLNLDSIKAASLIAAAAQRLGVAGRVPSTSLANARLADIAERLDALRGSAAAPEPAPAPAWVRTFIVALAEEPAPSVAQLAGARVALLADGDDAVAGALAQRLAELGAGVDRVGATGDEPGERPTHVVALTGAGRGDDEARVRATVARLRAAALLSRETDRDAPVVVALVQRGGGRFDATADGGAQPEAAAAVGFGASLHLERAEARVRVVDVHAGLAADAAARCVLAELGGDAGFIAAGWDADRVRRVRRTRLQPLGAGRERGLQLGRGDVVLVTGGARGITAECALALAGLGAGRFALVGSSALAGDPEIAATLRRFGDVGVEARYYRCDVTRSEDVAQLVTRVREELGPITVVLHGAGLNRPRRAEQVGVDAAMTEVAPKLLGALHLARALAAAPPRMFAAMTSVIGVTGMPGNAWYAFANAALDQALRLFAARHPGTQVASLAFSVWSGVGMGVKLGSVEALGRLDIGAIPVDEGVRRFVDVITRDPGEVQAIVTARMGSLDTFPPPLVAPAPVAGRFVAEPVRATPGVEWIGRATLSLAADAYLRDHLYRGSYLFPTVFGLEAMAQATAAAVGGAASIARIEDIKLERPIVVLPDAPARIEVHVLLLEPDAAGVRRAVAGIRTEATGWSVDHFAATLVLGERAEGDVEPVPGDTLELDPRRDLYGSILFQGPLFQRMRAVVALDSRRFVVRAEARAEPELVLGDPYLRDVLLQAVQPTIPGYSCLPVRIGALERFAGADSGTCVVTADLLAREGDEFVAEVTARDGSGRLVERIRGYRLRILHTVPDAPTAEALAQTRHRQAEPDVAPVVRVVDDEPAAPLVRDPVSGRREQRRRFVASFEDANTPGRRVGLARMARWMGRARELAFSPVAAALVAALAKGQHGLVTNGTQLVLTGACTALDRIESRLWLARFDDPSGEIGFEFHRVAADGSTEPVAAGRQRFTWVRILDHGVVAAEPLPPALRRFFDELRGPPDTPVGEGVVSPRLELGDVVADEVAREVAHERFATTREHANLVGNIYWANYFEWAAAVLDRLVFAAAPELARAGAGEAQITSLSVEHTREAMPFDRVRAALVARAVRERGAALDVHFFRETPGGDRTRLAAGRMEVAWLMPGGSGGAAAAAWPAGLRRALVEPAPQEDPSS